MKLTILGTCSGTEPYPGRHHTSFVIDYKDNLYWFDAGENCSYTACCMGIDLMKSRKIVISHTHMDHVGGLGNLMWNIRKMNEITGKFKNHDLDVFIPQIEAWNGLRQMLSFSEEGFKCNYHINAQEYGDGVLFEENGFKVTALHNRHMQKQRSAGDRWRSFGFLIQAEGKSIVYSGDTGGIEDFAPLLMPKCDILLMETGHHNPVAFVEEISKRSDCPGQVLFIHHGRQILDNFNKVNQEIKAILGGRVTILNDQTVLEV